jgi:hypothetical protein
MLDPAYYDPDYIVECPTCHRRFQTYEPFEGLKREVEEIQMEAECPNHDRRPAFPHSHN